MNNNDYGFTALTTEQMATIFEKLVNLRWKLLTDILKFYIDDDSNPRFSNLEELKKYEDLVRDLHEIASVIEGREAT